MFYFNLMRAFWPVIKNENVKYYNGIYNSQMKKVKESYQKKKKEEGRYVSFSDRVTLNYHISATFHTISKINF